MSPIATLQRGARTLGRIRTGTSRPGRGGKKVPTKLETFRLTSPQRELIEHAAAVFGGTCEPWEGGQWEVITEASSLDVVIPPGEIVDQWYELWSGGGCIRRCTGLQNVLTMGACECPADPAERNELAGKGEACKPTTRLRLMLPAVPDLGVWMLESHGYYAATELAEAANILAAATARGILLPARLRLDQRERKVPGQATKRYAVPVIEFPQVRMLDLMELAPAGTPMPQLGAGRVSVLEPPRADLPETSDFRAPVGDEPGDAALVDVGEALTELGRSIQETYSRAQGEPWAIVPATDEQKATLQIAFAGMPSERVSAGVEAVFGHPLPLRNAGEATALIAQLALDPPEEFRRRWILMIEAGRPGAVA